MAPIVLSERRKQSLSQRNVSAFSSISYFPALLPPPPPFLSPSLFMVEGASLGGYPAHPYMGVTTIETMRLTME